MNKLRAVGIVIENNKILLMHRTTDGREFWVFIGGSKEKNETVENAVVREVKEETGIKVKTIKLLYKLKHPDIDHEHHFYLCKYISGKPKLGNFNEMQTMKEGKHTYKPTWVELKKLPGMLLYPLEIRDWLIEDLKNSFKDTPRIKTLNSTNIRETI